MTLVEIVNLKSPLENLTSQKLPFSLAYKLAQLAKKVESNSEFYAESLRNLITEYAETDEEGNIKQDESNPNTIQIKTPLIEEFQNKFKELQSVEITDEIPMFKLSDFEDKIEISPQDLISLMPILKE
jgi:hypothetical protein